MSQSPKPPWRTPVIRAITDTHPHGGGDPYFTEGGHYTTVYSITLFASNFFPITGGAGGVAS